ncbi:aldehyde dehydrogenase [Allokutzneria sp. A3M-2-11 16]|uniref:aldehyde dehydrogenase family protein n=1 Tax=Allokutzneria sp. A3M-2-11 16 TaxID=2962043 RepID=UPI0020B772C3|nr:aldehyde dehydrogenase [Allokutzneria sp. A3M-2-11 16]MCP3803320.1 aldehyde dehydrogenase [Allokutzneria sp. A3M-2-11 16]
MRSYPNSIAGRDVSAGQWVHVLRASALLDDPMGAIRLKRELDRGTREASGDSRIAGRVAVTSVQHWEQAAAAAREAQRDWARRPLTERLALGDALHATFESKVDEFVEVLVAEGHPRRLALWEVAGVLQGLHPDTNAVLGEMLEVRRRAGDRDIRLVRKPDGVVALSPPQNAAASNSLLGLSTLLAGNAIVVKAPRSGPLGVAWAWREVVIPVLAECGAPPGTANLICGAPREVLDHWISSPDVDDLFYIGASGRGIELGDRATAAGKKAVLELSGNDGVLIWSDAEIDLAAQALVECFYGSSQICMVPKYAVVHPDVAERLIEALIARLDQVRPGLPEDERALLTPVLKTAGFFDLLGEATRAGATVRAGGERTDHKGVVDPAGVFLQPTVIDVRGLELAERLRAVREETFFPLLPIVVPEPAPDGELLESMLRFVDGNPYGLRNSLWARDPGVIDAFCATVSNGGLLKVNDSHLGFAPTLPTHGGSGLTGGPFGEANYPALRTSRLQGISIATDVTPRERIFDTALPGGA